MKLRSFICVLFLLAYAGTLFFFGLANRDLTSSHEARAGQNAQTILHDGDWLLPRLFDRHLELQKPPLYYWLVALIAAARGVEVDVWAVRLPAALSALVCVLFLALLGWRRGRPVAGFVAALVLASCLHFTWLARVGRIDMPLTCAVTLALGCFHLAATSPRRLLWCWLGYTALALGILLKGPIALVLVTLVAGAARSVQRDFTWRTTTLWWGLPWVLLLVAPWFVWANDRTANQLWEVFFWYHNVERGLGGSETLASYPCWFYLPRAAVDLLPWSLAAPLALWWSWRSDTDRDARLGLAWFGAIFLFLSGMSFKRADYLLPAYPGLALFLGVVAETAWLRYKERTHILRIGFAAVVVTYAAGWIGTTLWMAPLDQARPYQEIAQEIRRRTDMPVIFFRAEAHLLAFHVGPPVDTILEWENLEVWANRDFPVYFVMPADCAAEWRDHLPTGQLEEVLRTSDHVQGRGHRPWVVLRSRGQAFAGP